MIYQSLLRFAHFENVSCHVIHTLDSTVNILPSTESRKRVSKNALVLLPGSLHSTGERMTFHFYEGNHKMLSISIIKLKYEGKVCLLTLVSTKIPEFFERIHIFIFTQLLFYKIYF